MVSALEGVLNTLKKRADMTPLKDKITAADKCKPTDYTADSWEVFAQTLTEAKALAQNADLSEDDQQTVVEMAEKLGTAMDLSLIHIFQIARIVLSRPDRIRSPSIPRRAAMVKDFGKPLNPPPL